MSPPHAMLESGHGTPGLGPLRALAPYLWPKGRRDLKLRVVFAVICLVLAKVATVSIPFFFGRAVDDLSGSKVAIALLAPISLIVAYGFARIMMQAFAQLRDGIFAKVAYHAVRRIALETFRHMHGLSLRFHLERKTGGLSRIIERGTKGIDTLLSFAIFSIFPTILELVFVTAIMLWRFDVWFALTTVSMVGAYIWFTFAVTRWRVRFRREMNESDTDANTKAVDSLLNYETVKYFNNEDHEASRFDHSMGRYTKASIKTQISLSVLNAGQAVIVSTGLAAIMILAAVGIKDGRYTVGDLVMANSFLIQLYVPLNLLGTVYREITQALVDMESMFSLLHQPQEVEDRPGAPPLAVSGGEIRFEDVVFSYDADRTVLKGISFTVPAGKTVAVVGPSGAGKSTISRILYRFYDVKGGRVTIDGQDIRDVTQASLRGAIGIVPQDTVLFNDTIRYNIAYGRLGASEAEIEEAARMAQIDDFIRELPDGLRIHGRRARAQALRRREAARGHRPHDPEEPADPAARRGDLGARHPHRARDPERPARGLEEPHHPGHRPPPVDRDRRRRDPGARPRRDRRARPPRRARRHGRPLCLDVEQAEGSGRGARTSQGGGNRSGGQPGGRPGRPRARRGVITPRPESRHRGRCGGRAAGPPGVRSSGTAPGCASAAHGARCRGARECDRAGPSSPALGPA